MKYLLLAALLGATMNFGIGTASAQEPQVVETIVGEPPIPDACQPSHERVLFNAVNMDDVVVLLVSANSDYSYDTGVLLSVHAEVEGRAPTGEVNTPEGLRTNVQSAVPCFAVRTWPPDGFAARGELVVGVFLVWMDSDPSLHSAWPVFESDGTPMTAAAFDAGAPDVGALTVRLPDASLITIDDLIEAGRDFVEPTPEPTPEGIPTPDPTTLIVDTGFGEPPEGVTLPQTGADGDSRSPWAPFAAGVIAVLVVLAVGTLLKLRRRASR